MLHSALVSGSGSSLQAGEGDENGLSDGDVEVQLSSLCNDTQMFNY